MQYVMDFQFRGWCHIYTYAQPLLWLIQCLPYRILFHGPPVRSLLHPVYSGAQRWELFIDPMRQPRERRGIAMVTWYTKFKFSNFSPCRDRNDDLKLKKDVFGVVRIKDHSVKIDRLHRNFHKSFIVTLSLYGIVLFLRYWSRMAIFLPHPYLAFRIGWLPWNFIKTIRIIKTESQGYHTVLVMVMNGAVLIQYWRLTNGETDSWRL